MFCLKVCGNLAQSNSSTTIGILLSRIFCLSSKKRLEGSFCKSAVRMTKSRSLPSWAVPFTRLPYAQTSMFGMGWKISMRCCLSLLRSRIVLLLNSLDDFFCIGYKILAQSRWPLRQNLRRNRERCCFYYLCIPKSVRTGQAWWYFSKLPAEKHLWSRVYLRLAKSENRVLSIFVRVCHTAPK